MAVLHRYDVPETNRHVPSNEAILMLNKAVVGAITRKENTGLFVVKTDGRIPAIEDLWDRSIDGVWSKIAARVKEDKVFLITEITHVNPRVDRK